MRGLFFNRSTTPRTADFIDDGLNERRHSYQPDTLKVHVFQQGLARGIHKIQLRQIEHRFAIRGGGLRGLPALAEFPDPRSGKSAFQPEAKFAGAVEQSDL
jgi:hypothetical protein